MPQHIKISSEQQLLSPELRVFSTQRDRILAENDLIILDSPKLIRRLYESGGSAEAILCDQRFASEALQLGRQHTELKVYETTSELLNTLAGHRIFHGAIAIAKRPKRAELLKLGPQILALDGINQAENVGSLVRSALAFETPSILVNPSGLSPWARRAIRVSMGAVWQADIRISRSFGGDLRILKELGYTIAVAHCGDSAVPYHSYRWRSQQVLVIGSEGLGPSSQVLELADQQVKIPINAAIDSLNAATAGAILLAGWHTIRQGSLGT